MNKISKTLFALVLVLCLTATVTISIAYFTDYEDAKGGAVMTLSGGTEVTEEMKDNNKLIKVVNTGETDMIVRVMIYGDADHMTIRPGSGWIKSDQDGAYYYKSILKGSEDGKSGDETSVIEAAISAEEEEDLAKFDITVIHEGARVIYEGDGVETPDGWDADVVAQISIQ